MWKVDTKWRHILAIILLSALTACGGGGGGSDPAPQEPPAETPDETPDEEPDEEPDDTPTVSIGTFIPGPVKGLHFETSTQSGLTNDAGEFQYQDGETVTFSIGGIELGSAAGAEKINLAELFGAVLPTTEAGLRAELENWGKITDLDRVANAIMLLMALDVDGDISNGLNLSGRHEQLADASISFDFDLYSFAYDNTKNGLYRLRRVAQIPGEIYPYVPLHYLYEALGIRVAVQAQIESKQDTGAPALDGIIDYRWTTGYDSLGLPASYSYDYDADGNPDYTGSTIRDDYGRDLSYSYSSDSDDDGTANNIYTSSYAWHDNGNQHTGSYAYDSDADGVADEIEETAYTYDAAGNPIESRSETDSDNDGTPDELSSYIRTFDEMGNTLTQVYEKDNNADGTVDSKTITNYAYEHDSVGNLLSRIQKSDTDADGQPDTINISTYTYDDAGNRLSYVSEEIRDAEVDSVTIDYRNSYEYSYDAAGNRTGNVSEYDSNADGVIDSKSTYEAEFDSDGNQLWSKSISNFGKPNEYSYQYEYQYDADGNVTEYFYEYKRTDLSKHNTQLTTYTYDENGNQTVGVTQYDDDADGSFNKVVTNTYEYNEQGAQVSSLNEEDSDNDGDVDKSNLQTSSYQTLEQGVMYLMYYYWD